MSEGRDRGRKRRKGWRKVQKEGRRKKEGLKVAV